LDDSINEDNAGDIPLVKYGARHWFDHAGFENVASGIRDAMEYFFDSDKPHWTAWTQVQMVDGSLLDFKHNVEGALPLYYASLGGFYDLVENLIDKHPEHINARGGTMMTSLVAALHGKHFEIAELLHRYGADVDVWDDLKNTLLRQACFKGRVLDNVDIVQWLLNHGADVNARGTKRCAPLYCAAWAGQLPICRMLIEHNANIFDRMACGLSPLHAAARHGTEDHVNIMQVLLDHGADPNARDGAGSTPLHSVDTLPVEGTRVLLKRGATIDAEDNQGNTPLQVALKYGRDDIATCLREHGATR
jgi:ankyrin repeat protein